MRRTNVSPGGDLEVVVRDPAAERLDHELAARPDTRCDLLRLHPAILDWPRMTVRALLLDFNGTLSEDEPLLFAIFEDLFASAGKPIAEPEVYDRLAGLSDPEVVEAWLGKPDPAVVARKVSSTGNALQTATRSRRRPGRRCEKRPSTWWSRSCPAPRGGRSSLSFAAGLSS